MDIINKNTTIEDLEVPEKCRSFIKDNSKKVLDCIVLREYSLNNNLKASSIEDIPKNDRNRISEKVISNALKNQDPIEVFSKYLESNDGEMKNCLDDAFPEDSNKTILIDNEKLSLNNVKQMLFEFRNYLKKDMAFEYINPQELTKEECVATSEYLKDKTENLTILELNDEYLTQVFNIDPVQIKQYRENKLGNTTNHIHKEKSKEITI